MARPRPDGADLSTFSDNHLNVLLAVLRTPEPSATDAIAVRLGLPVRVTYGRLQQLRNLGFLSSRKEGSSPVTFWSIQSGAFPNKTKGQP